jgi:2'-5' RNA ligase
MHNLKHYLKEAELQDQVAIDPDKGTYAALNLDHRSAIRLEQFCHEQNIKCIKHEDFHVTVVYSRKGIPAIADYPIKFPIVAKVKSFGTLPSLKGDQNALVCFLDSKQLHDLFNVFVSEYGAEWDYEDYKPHITIDYDYRGNTLPKNIPLFPINLTSIKIEEIDPEWSSDTNE